MYSIVHEEPKPLKGIKRDLAPDVQKVVDRALKKNQDSRYQTAAEVSEDLRKYQEMLRAAEAGVFNLRSFLRRIRQPKIALPTALGIMAIALLSVWFFNRQAKIRWARNIAIPEIERMVAANDCWRNLVQPYRLAQKVEAIIPRDPKLTELFSQCALNIDIRTEPSGARVYMKEYTSPDAEWIDLGVTPIEKVRVPVGIFRWEFEKDGYETVLAAASTWGRFPPMRILDKKGTLPPGMVRVEETETPIGKLSSFLIDKYEVTNRQYKEFVDAGGYRNKEYWKHSFVKDGRELTWEEAMKGFVDMTEQAGPSTWQAGDYPEGQAEYPVSGVSWYEAAAYAEFAGKSLPTSTHWDVARGAFTPMLLSPQLGGFAILAPFCNFGGKGGPVPVGSLPGITAFGAFDMAGNVREWCWNETPAGRVIRGGAWGDNTYMFGILSQAPGMDRSPKNGFRCALYPDPKSVPQAAFQAVKPPESKDFYKEKPVPDAIFQVYKEQYSYDKRDLNARVESRKENPDGWIMEKVSFDAAYGGERVIAYLFLPKNSSPPYQTVIYFPGGASEWTRSSQDIESYYEYPMFLSYIVKNGRAVLYPVYKGTFERGSDDMTNVLDNNRDSHQYVEIFIQEVKDFRRCVDYLEMRPDIDSGRIAYYGMSWGGWLGAIIPAVEERLKASVLLGGCIDGIGRAEVKDINYVGRVKIPTLMLNGKYDSINPLGTTIKPMFDLLGTPDEQKDLKLYDTDHIPPYNEYVKETLAWLDKYLGSVKR